MKQRYLKIMYWLILIALSIAIVSEVSAEEFDKLRPLEGDGAYLIRRDELLPRENVDIMIVEDGKIHLYYIDNELVNVYSIGGVFLYGIQFPDGQKGVSDMHYADGLLYVDARMSGMYVFRDMELIRFESQHYQNDGHDELEAMFTGEYRHTDGDFTYLYVTENNRVIRNGRGGTEVLIQFPQKSPHINGLLLLFGGWILGGCFYYEMKRGRFPPYRA